MESNKENLENQEPSIYIDGFVNKNKVIVDEFIDMAFLKSWKQRELASGLIKFEDPAFDRETNGILENIPINGANVNILHELRDEKGELQDKTRNRKQKDKYKLKDMEDDTGYEKVIRNMIKGEISWFKMSPKYHDPRVLQNSTQEDLYWKVNLEYVKNIKHTLLPLDYDGRIKQSLTMKEDGNKLLKSENYERAVSAYKGALGIMTCFPKELTKILTEGQKNEVKELIISLKNNCLLVSLKRKDYSEGITLADEILKEDPKNSKAQLRRIACLIGKIEIDEAKTEIEQRLKSEDYDAETKEEFKRLLNDCQKRDSTGKKMANQCYKKMFEGNTDIEEKEEEEKRLKDILTRKQQRLEKEREKELGFGNEKYDRLGNKIVDEQLLLDGTIITDGGFLFDVNDPKTLEEASK